MSNFAMNYHYPTSYRLGAGRRKELANVLDELGIASPLLVTDQNVAQLPWFLQMLKNLKELGKPTKVFDRVHPNPIESDVVAACDQYRRSNCDGVVVVGGGSAMDAGKCVALLAEYPHSIFDFEDEGENWKRADAEKIAKIVAIPTTAGTGSEVGRASVILNEHHEKKIIFHPQLFPRPELALVDAHR